MEKTIGKIKNKAYLIIIGAFIIGLITGSLLMNLVIANAPLSKKQSVTDELANELHLSTDQKRKVEEIYGDSRKRSKEIFKAIQPQLDQIRDQTKAQVRLLLDQNQQIRYESWCINRESPQKKNGVK